MPQPNQITTIDNVKNKRCYVKIFVEYVSANFILKVQPKVAYLLLLMCETDTGGEAEHHSLKLKSSDQAAIFDELGGRTCCIIISVEVPVRKTLETSIFGRSS